MSDWRPAPAINFQPGRSSLRVGDAERDEAIRLLGEHFAAGRLDHQEYDERSSRALGARTFGDLDVLFRDLPVGQPVGPRRPSRPPWAGQQRRSRRGPRLLPVLLILVGLAIVLSSPWLVFIGLGVLFFLKGRSCGSSRMHAMGNPHFR